MWHEARKQERMIRGLIVDYRRRAERRKDFYEKIKAEPTQFLQLHGRPCKIHLDPAVAAAGEGPAIMMPWQGDQNNLIDRFDVRAHLDFIPEEKYPDIPPEELNPEERQFNYERYRILAQNVFLGISEDKFLQQLAIEEQFGVTIEEKEMQKEKLNEKKGTGAAIGYNYNDPGAQPSCSHGPDHKRVEHKDSDDDDSDLELIDVDLSIDVNKMEASQAHELNAVGPQFGMAGCDLFSFLTGDADDAEHQKQLLREEKEKAMFSGRKSRRERRAHRDKKLAHRVVSPPSYAAPRADSSPRSAQGSGSPGRSPSPAPDHIEFITSFGGEEEDNAPAPSKPLYADKLKLNLKKDRTYSEVVKKPKDRSPRPMMGPHGPPKSRSVSRSRSRSPSPSRSKSRSRSRLRSRSRSQSRSRSYRRSYSRSRSSSRSRSRSPSHYSRSRRRRSRSSQNHGYSKHNNTRSMSYESGSRAQPVARYYGRRREDRSSSELSLGSASSDSTNTDKPSAVGSRSNTNQSQFRLSGTSTKGPSRETLSLKEKLRKKMQAQLSRQLRADKRAEAERLERESRRQLRRDQEMRELAIKLRRKQREMRHQQNRRSSDEDSAGSRSGSSSRDSNPVRKRDRSHSKSPSPQEKRIPIWENDQNSPTVPYRPKMDDNVNRRRYEDDRKFEKPREYQYDKPARDGQYDRPLREYDRTREYNQYEKPREYSQYDKTPKEYSQYDKTPREYSQYDKTPKEYSQYDKTPREYSQYDKTPREYGQYEKKYERPKEQYERQTKEYNQHDKPREYQPREQYDKFPRDYNRFDNQLEKKEYQNEKPTRELNRWDQDKFSSRRRPFQGGYRGQGYRSGPNRYGDGPSNYRDESDDKEDYPKNKVKLVDY